MADDKECPTCGIGTIPTEEAGDDWLNCIIYTGKGAKDPAGINMPTGWMITDLIDKVFVFRNRKMVEILPEDFVKGKDKIITVTMNEEIIKMLYDNDPRAITLIATDGTQPEGHSDGFTRLEWYEQYAGRDGLRTAATSRMKLGLQSPRNIGKIGGA